MVEAMELRPMGEPDVAAVHEVARPRSPRWTGAAGARRGRPARRLGAPRIRRLIATDPGGAWVAETPDGALAGAALALVREGLWGLSLLVVDPGRQSAGVGRALLDRALAYGDTARAAGSSSPRRIRGRCAPTRAPASRSSPP